MIKDQVPSTDENVSAFKLSKNRRLSLEAGSLMTNTVVKVDRPFNLEARTAAEIEGRRLCEAEWKIAFSQDIPWDRCSWSIVHISFQCLVELIVSPYY